VNSNALIDVALGLILMYLVLGLVCTSINEAISTLAGMRAATLQNALARIIDDQGLRTVFNNHGLVAAAKSRDGAHPSYLSGETFALALLDSLNANPKSPIPTIQDILASAQALPASNVRDLIVSNIATAQDNLNVLRTNLAKSFDQAMDRVSGIYKRNMQWISFAVGFAVALAINADSIAVGSSLWSDGALREQMSRTAQTFLPASPGTSDPKNSDLAQLAQRFHQAEDEFRPLPVGWTLSAFPFADETAKSAILKIGGLAITAVALMLGAPFWFDLLSKFIKIRGTGDKPARTGTRD
jgi:hypothetical protein